MTCLVKQIDRYKIKDNVVLTRILYAGLIDKPTISERKS